MDSNASSSGFFLNPSPLHSVYYQGQEDDGIIDLALSLKTCQPQQYPPPGHLTGQEGYDEIILGWAQGKEEEEEEEEVVQSRESWGYVKVNMDGVVVGRKVYILNHGDYSTLALQLEHMFGNGLRLFNPGSEFCLLYKDREDNWRSVGDVPWRVFVECVKRLRIARRNST